MSKKNRPVLPVHDAQKVISKKTVELKDIKQERIKTIIIPYPYILLALIVLLVYSPSFGLGFTELDDSIFIREYHAYNEDWANLITSFHRGIFDAVKDTYYRPLFLDSIILNYKLCGQNILGYHIINILLHAGSVLLLYRLFQKLKVRDLHAFILATLFAVHPVLVQAVSWIPGRNDMMLALFTFSFFINAINYATDGRLTSLLLSSLFLLLAYFTKETAIFAAPVALVMIMMFNGIKWNDKKNIVQYVNWVICFGIWYYVRSTATIQNNKLDMAQLTNDFMHHLPVVVQYVGKVLLPFNLSVFPIQSDTVLYYGIAAIIIIVIAIITIKDKNWKTIIGSLSIFFIFLIPVLFVPDTINKETYEHRLYLPIIGILLLLPQTQFFKNSIDSTILTFSMVLCALMAVTNIRHQRNFSDPITFWQQAVETSPNSAYANSMLGARLDNVVEANLLYRKAYELDPKQKYLNFYIAEMLQNKDSVLASEPYLLAEKEISGYYKCNFLLARVAMTKNDFPSAINYLQSYLRTDSLHALSNYNLYCLYLQSKQTDLATQQAETSIRRLQLVIKISPNDKFANSDLLLIYFHTGQVNKAKEQLKEMQLKGLAVPNELIPPDVVRQISMQ